MTRWAGLIGSPKASLVNPNSNIDLTGFRANEPVRSLGQIANDLLARDCAGKILAVVTDAAYLQTNDDELFWLAHDNVPMHARGVRCEFDEKALRVGMSFAARAAILRIGERVTIDLRDAEEWKPRTIAPLDVASREVVSVRARVIARHGFCAEAIPESLIGDCFAKTARNDITAMTRLRDFIGLGAGLTPAGDDFVGGILFTAHHLRETYALTWDTQPIDDLLNWARPQTNVISYTLLHDHARGIGVEPLHDLLFALLARDASDDATECAARLARIGSSTGEEILAGALTGMRLIEDKGNSE